jgi:hypothetical protein
MSTPAELLQRWLTERASRENCDWLQAQLDKVLRANSDRDLHITLGMIPRKFGRDDLSLSADELAAAHAARPNWNPAGWSIDTAARILVLCRLAERGEEQFGATFTDLSRSADLAESIALYSGVPLYPAGDALDEQIGEGLRTNMRAVFEAIAHHNPYPAENFSENRWNHMVLKALFIDSTLAPIQGLDDRANAELATILCDYAHERWAAGRPVTPELWRCVGPFATGPMIDDLARVIDNGTELERQAALLALAASSDPAAREIVGKFPETGEAIANGSLTWDSLTAAVD